MCYICDYDKELSHCALPLIDTEMVDFKVTLDLLQIDSTTFQNIQQTNPTHLRRASNLQMDPSSAPRQFQKRNTRQAEAQSPKRPTRLCTTCIGRVLAHRNAPRLLTFAAATTLIAQLTLGHGNRPSWRSRPASLTARAGHAGPRAAATDQFLHPCGCGLQNLNKILQSPLAWDFDHALQFTPG